MVELFWFFICQTVINKDLCYLLSIWKYKLDNRKKLPYKTFKVIIIWLLWGSMY